MVWKAAFKLCAFKAYLNLVQFHMKLPGNCNIGLFIFRHHFHIMRPKFLKFEKVNNFAKKFWKLQKQKSEVTKLKVHEWKGNLSPHMINKVT